MADINNVQAVLAVSLIHIVVILLLTIPAPFSLPFAAGTASDASQPPKLLLISFDGFGWNFLGKPPKSQIPNIEKFIEKGVHVRWVENAFPTVTRTNHMSLVSGLYAESHGIVHNDFFDPVLNATMPGAGQLKEDDSKWVDKGAEPIWVTNSKAGNGRRSGTIYWPCADAKIKGRLPDEIKQGEWTVTEDKVTPNERIDWALDWLTGKSTQPVNFVAVYMNEPDEISHQYGPDSQEVYNSIISRDSIVEYLLSEIKKRNLEEQLNVIITADHGQAPVYHETLINADLLVDSSLYTAYPNMHGFPVVMANIWPKEGQYQKVVDGLKGKHRNLHVATSSDSEDLMQLHYSTSPRIAPIVIYAEPGWVIGKNDTTLKLNIKLGDHGWDPRYAPDMYPFFIALGPAFKKGLRNAEPFHIVDIYPLMCHILGVTPAANEGSIDKVSHILSSPPAEKTASQSSSNYTGVVIGILVVILVVIIVIVIIKYVRYTSRNVSASYKRTFTNNSSTDDLMEDNMVVISDEEL